MTEAATVRVEATGETVGEAKWSALRELEKQNPGIDKAAVRFQVVSEGERGLLGVGYAPARVIATVPLDSEPAVAEPRDESELATELRELMERIDWLHTNFDSPVLIEEYVEGREMYVGVLGNDKPEALPVIELDLSKLPEGIPRIAAAEVKWGKGTAAYRDPKSAIATDLPDETVQLLHQTAIAAYQALELRDYGRVDIRLQPDGKVHVIEVNPNPWLASRAEFAMAARKAGRTYPQLVEEIVELAMARA